MRIRERDLKLFKSLYDNRIYAAGQIKRGFYGNMPYGYSRIRELKKHGYLDSKAYVEGRKKVTAVYWVTNKAINELEIKNPRDANKNKITDKYSAGRQIIINEVHVRLRQYEYKEIENNDEEYTWEWMDSRETKEYFNINRGDIISGSLFNNKTNEKYAIYVAGITKDIKKNVERHQGEIYRHNVLRDNIILCDHPEAFKQFRQIAPNGGSLRVLPYDEGIALIYNLLSQEDNIKALFSEVMQIENSTIKTNRTIFCTHKSNNINLVELLTNDIVMQNNIKKLYIADKKQEPLNIICWDTQVKEIKTWAKDERISIYPIAWSNSPLLQNVDENYKLISKPTKLPESKKKKMVGATVPPDLYQYIEQNKEQTQATTSDIINKALEFYKQHHPVEFNFKESDETDVDAK